MMDKERHFESLDLFRGSNSLAHSFLGKISQGVQAVVNSNERLSLVRMLISEELWR